MDRWRGLRALVQDAVEGGSRAVERVQLETARTPFAILEQIPKVAAPAKAVHLLYEVSVASTHGMIRLVTRAVGATLELVIDAVEGGTSEPDADDPPPPS